MFSTEVIIDADLSETGWEIVVRLDAESVEAAWSDLSDAQLQSVSAAIGRTVVDSIIAVHDENQ